MVVVRESLGYAKDAREATRIISAGRVKVDWQVRKDSRFPVGLMDIVQIEGIKQAYRVLPKPKRGLSLSRVEDSESTYKLCKIVGKRTIRGGHTQLILHDGRSLTLKTRDIHKEDNYEVGGSLQIYLPVQRVAKHIPFTDRSIGLVTEGRNQGFYGKVIAITTGTYGRRKIARIETPDENFETPADYVIPVGTETPLVAIDR